MGDTIEVYASGTAHKQLKVTSTVHGPTSQPWEHRIFDSPRQSLSRLPSNGRGPSPVQKQPTLALAQTTQGTQASNLGSRQQLQLSPREIKTSSTHNVKSVLSSETSFRHVTWQQEPLVGPVGKSRPPVRPLRHNSATGSMLSVYFDRCYP
jgi:hypothetical protein